MAERKDVLSMTKIRKLRRALSPRALLGEDILHCFSDKKKLAHLNRIATREKKKGGGEGKRERSTEKEREKRVVNNRPPLYSSGAR